jgi:hypothetical protein
MYGEAAGHHLAAELVEHAPAYFRDLWDAADFVLGEWGDGREPSGDQLRWRRTLKAFADACFAGDQRRATYCLKDKHNWRLFKELKASYREVDYSRMVEKDGAANFQAEISCAGGACES